MAYYLVRAKAHGDLRTLREKLDQDVIVVMRPFGTALDYSLRNARIDEEGYAVWEEEDYCSPPLAMERQAVLDTYFTDLVVEKLEHGEGWSRIEHLPSFWDTV